MKLPFSAESNYNYRVDSVDVLKNNSWKILAKIVNHFLAEQVPRLETLDKYSKGQNETIYDTNRRIDNTKADNRIAHNFGKLISQFVAGYTTSVPIKYVIGDTKQQEVLDDFNDKNSIATLDNELMTDVAKYGRAFDIQYKNETGEKVRLSSVFETLVIQDATIEHNPLAGVRVVSAGFQGDNNTDTTYTITLYTDHEIITFAPMKNGDTTLVEVDTQIHFYGSIPITEYTSNNSRIGWYEDVLSLIDAYDMAVSDGSNYIQDVVNSLLVISGDFKVPDKGIDELIRQIKSYGILGLQSGYGPDGKATSVSADYISPSYDSQTNENNKDRLRKDIFTLSNVPDMADENFSGNSSGVAMRYKIFGFEQSIGQTINNFKRGLQNRYKALFGLLVATSKATDQNGLTMTFTPNLPYAVSEEAQMLNDAGVPISRKTMYNQTHFTNSETEEANLKEEATVDEKDNKKPLEFDTDKVDGKDNDNEQ